MNRLLVAVAAFALGAVVAVVAVLGLPALGDDDPGIEVGDTFEAEVKSYFDASGPEPNVICFERDGDTCGLPLFASETTLDLEPGDRVQATEIWLQGADGIARLAFFVRPAD